MLSSSGNRRQRANRADRRDISATRRDWLRWTATGETASERPFNQGVEGSSPSRLTRNYRDFGDTSPTATDSCADSCAETSVGSGDFGAGSTSSSTATAARRVIRREVAVPHRHGDRLMTESFLYLLEGPAPLHQPRGKGVAQVVEPESLDTC